MYVSFGNSAGEFTKETYIFYILYDIVTYLQQSEVFMILL